MITLHLAAVNSRTVNYRKLTVHLAAHINTLRNIQKMTQFSTGITKEQTQQLKTVDALHWSLLLLVVSSSIGACRWRCCSCECPPSCSVLSSLKPDARPRLNWRRSSSTVLSQVCLEQPGRRLQFLGAGDMQVCRARKWSWDLSARATWPNNFRRLIRTVSDSSGWPVRRRTSKFVTHFDQVMFRIRRRHHWSKASILFSIALVMDHVSAPYKKYWEYINVVEPKFGTHWDHGPPNVPVQHLHIRGD